MIEEYFSSHLKIEVSLKAYSGEEGFKLIQNKQNEYDAIILDLIMPNKDGIYVLEEMKSNGEEDIFYHKSDDGTRLEIDFMIQRDGKLLPIEVKAEGNVRANSLSNLLKQTPELHAFRYSMKPYIEQEQMTCYPLYAIQ